MTVVSAPASPTVRGVWRSGRGVVLVAGLVLLAAALPVLLAGQGSPAAQLDPRSGSLDGGAALAALLRQQAVEVTRVASVSEARSAAGTDGLVLVSRPGTLTRAQAEQLAGSGAELLVVGTAHAGTFLPRIGARVETQTLSLTPKCRLPAAVRAGAAYLGGASFDREAGSDGCYPLNGRPTLVSDGRVTLLADGQFMTNRRLDEDGNAALAMNLAGDASRLAWLVAPEEGTNASDAAGRSSLVALIPTPVWWSAGTLALAVMLAAVWRGRRLGPVVTERLPAVVRAAETVEGRGRLYRAHRARFQAARAMRSAAVTRIVSGLHLAAAAPPRVVVDAVAAWVDEDAQEVERLLFGATPDDDRALVQLADELDVLERKVRQR
jgi:hypothetical protein